MRGRGRTVAALAGLLALVGGYGVADAADVVPGVLTTQPRPADPQPYPAPDLPGEGIVPAQVRALDREAPLPTTEGLEALLEGLLDDPRMAGDPGMVVTDALTGEVLVSRDGDTPRTTASSIKVLTAVAALGALGPDHVLTTRVVRPEAGTLVLVGGGDIMLAAGAGDPEEVNGRAGLADLAAATAERLAADGEAGVRLRLDDTAFSGPLLAEDWAGADLRYVMPIQPVAVDRGRSGGFYLRDPALAAAEAFAEALREAGVEVTGAVGRAAAPEDAETVAEVHSAPLGQLVDHALKVSDNSVTEALARMVALERGVEATFDGATDSVLAELGDLGVDVSGIRMVDASGLSVRDQVPPSALVEILRTATSGEHPRLNGLAAALPVAGLDGTLADRMRGEAAAGLVRAKTGTLVQTVSLSGSVVTVDGRRLVFSTLINDLPAGTAHRARLAIDAWATELAACGCR